MTPPVQLDILVEDGGWDADRTRAIAESVIAAAVAELSLGGLSEVGLRLDDDDGVRALNRDWRGQDKPTNVLSFPAFPGRAGTDLPPMLGDIVLARQTVAREAEAEEKPFEDHVAHLVAHGLLHLLGYDHGTDAEAERMEGVERRILARLAIPDPYL